MVRCSAVRHPWPPPAWRVCEKCGECGVCPLKPSKHAGSPHPALFPPYQKCGVFATLRGITPRKADIVDILNLSEEQQALADALNPRELAFANLWLTSDEHGMCRGACYEAAGFKVKNRNVAYVQAYTLLRKPKMWDYCRAMRALSINETGLTLQYLDEQLRQIIDGTAPQLLSSYANVTGGVDDETGAAIVLHNPILRCAIDDLPEEVQAAIQSVKMTKYGPEIKLYSRVDAIRLAAQRLGGLTDRKELSGPGGGPIQTSSLTDTELDARIQRLMDESKPTHPED